MAWVRIDDHFDDHPNVRRGADAWAGQAKVEEGAVNVGSLFSGIGGLDLGLERAGMTIRWQVEIDEFCRRVLAKHWPNVARYGDIRELSGKELEPVDLVCGGFPCQDLSVAGRRAGLAGERSGLFFEFVRIAAELRPAWVLLENVPGLLSSNGGRDMGTVLGTLAELGYWWAYRSLDARYFHLAQRRKRVFIVGHLGEPRSAPAAVLFEPESCGWHPAPGRRQGQGVTQALTRGFGKGGADDNAAQGGFLVPEVSKAITTSVNRLTATEQHAVFSVGKGSYPVYAEELAQPITGRRGDPGHIAHTLRAEGFDASEDGTGRGTPIVAVGFQERSDLSHALRANPSKADKPDSTTYLASEIAVRRLTPLECERLQGFPDGWTALDGRASDSARYRALGNAVAVPVAEWIGRRIGLVCRG